MEKPIGAPDADCQQTEPDASVIAPSHHLNSCDVTGTMRGRYTFCQVPSQAIKITGYPLHRKNRESGAQKKFNVRENTGN